MSTEPLPLSAASKTFIRGVLEAVLGEVSTAEAVWEALSDGLDQESLLDLARRAARQQGVPDDVPITLDPVRGLALLGLNSAGSVLRLLWDGTRFAPLKDGVEPRPALARGCESKVLALLNTPEATWERLAKGRSEAEVLDLARQTALGLCQGSPLGEVRLDPEQGGALAYDDRGRYVCTLRWNEDLDSFVHYWSESSVLLTVETLRSVCADLY